MLDNRHAAALTRALGATPRDVTLALAAAQVLPALAGAVLGVFPGGYLLFAALMAVTGATVTGPRCPRPGSWSCWSWSRRWWWRRSPPCRPASAAVVR